MLAPPEDSYTPILEFVEFEFFGFHCSSVSTKRRQERVRGTQVCSVFLSSSKILRLFIALQTAPVRDTHDFSSTTEKTPPSLSNFQLKAETGSVRIGHVSVYDANSVKTSILVSRGNKQPRLDPLSLSFTNRTSSISSTCGLPYSTPSVATSRQCGRSNSKRTIFSSRNHTTLPCSSSTPNRQTQQTFTPNTRESSCPLPYSPFCSPNLCFSELTEC